MSSFDEVCNGSTEAGQNECRSLFDNFRAVSILNQDAQQKTIYLHGKTHEKHGEEGDAVLIMERTPFSEKTLRDVMSPETSLSIILKNDLYTSMTLYPKPIAGALKSTLIFPATDKHIEKYSAQKIYMIRETAEDYRSITLPHVTSSSLSHQWLENILLKKSETERIVCEDSNPQTGFILIPDLKWDCQQLSNLYLCALVMKRGIRSIRDLREEHIPMLENVRDKGKSAIREKYGFDPAQLRIYFHYPPSYYHLHVHFANVVYDSPSCALGKAHLLDDVVDNLKRDSEYYARVSISYVLKENDGLFQKFKAAGRV